MPELQAKLGSSPDGLSQVEAQKRLTQYGPNVSLRQACVNRLEGCGIVGCQRTMLWRTADEH